MRNNDPGSGAVGGDEAPRAEGADGVAAAAPARSGTVQAVERAVDLLEAMADAGGTVSLSHLAATSGLPLPTIHRLVRTLAGRGYVRQQSSREYALGPRLVRLGDTAGRLVGVWARPRLAELVDELGESANLALLEGPQVVYVAQEPGRHSMRMFTEVGRRVSPHCTAVGKALLARMTPEKARDILRRTELVRHTDNTITTREGFEAELEKVRVDGYAVDEGEQELGVRCVAVALDGPLPAAVSISGPTTRMTDALVASAVPRLQAAAAALVDEMARQDAATA